MFSRRLQALRKTRQITQSQLAKHLGLTQQAVAKWEKSLSLPETGILSRIADYFDVSTDYLLGITDALTSPGDFAAVRVVGTVKSGYGALAFEEDLGRAPADVRDPDEYRYLVVRGDSMEPYIQNGDLALVKLQSTLRSGELGILIYGDGEATLKKYYCIDGVVTLVPFNESYQPVTIRGEELNSLIIYGKVVETHRKW